MYNLEATTYEAFEKDIVKYTQVSVKYLDSIYLLVLYILKKQHCSVWIEHPDYVLYFFIFGSELLTASWLFYLHPENADTSQVFRLLLSPLQISCLTFVNIWKLQLAHFLSLELE
jgi:hypothetical protein